ncbi:MAG TPA: class I SAM-dependent methyltransferase [Gemmatimonadaceae bacterium]|nr:class I SAM-dependent methyltransferase [Gemmatimonadaceae bacterium]
MSFPRYRFDREHNLHETRDTAGLNRLRPASWLRRNDRVVQLRTVEILEPLTRELRDPVILVVGVGGGGIYEWLWREPGTLRLGLDVNHEVMRRAVAERGPDNFRPIEGDAARLPFRDGAADVVFFDFSLHHLAGQGPIEPYVAEAARVARRGGLLVAREPSSWSPSGAMLNILNRFGLMNRLSGASNYEFALSPAEVRKALARHADVVAERGLSYMFAHRLPIWLQKGTEALEPLLFRGERAQRLADFVLYVARRV